MSAPVDLTGRKRVTVVEHKSTSSDISPGGRFWTKCELDTQISNYVAGVRELGYEADSVTYDVVRKLAIEPKKATPLEERKYTQGKSKACAECKKKAPAPLPHADAKTGLECRPMMRTGDGAQDWRDWSSDDGHDQAQPEKFERRVLTDPGGALYATMRETDETLDEFRARCIAEVGESPEKYLQRSTVVRLEEDERDAAFDTWQIGNQIRESQRLGRWPRNPDACELYNRLCEYHVVCTRKATIDDDSLYQTEAAAHAELEAPRRFALPILSTSSAKAYRACNRKYQYAYVLRRRPRERSHALRWGTLIHVGLEAWWKGAHSDVQLAIDAMRDAAAGQEIDAFDLVKAEVLLHAYHLRWKDEPLRVVAVEREFEAQLINPETGHASRTWVRGGKLDAVAEVIAREEDHADCNREQPATDDHHKAEEQVA